MEYYNTCKPLYCEVTILMGLLNMTFWSAEFLGGVMAIIAGKVNIVLSPAVAFFLRWYYKNSERDDRSCILPVGVRLHDLENLCPALVESCPKLHFRHMIMDELLPLLDWNMCLLRGRRWSWLRKRKWTGWDREIGKSEVLRIVIHY